MTVGDEIDQGTHLSYRQWKTLLFQELRAVVSEDDVRRMRGMPHLEEFRQWFIDPNASYRPIESRWKKKRTMRVVDCPDSNDRPAKHRRLRR